MEIDEQAPAIAEAKIAIQAKLETVWGIQTDIDRWSEWNPGVQWSKLNGPLAVGSVFRWKSRGSFIVSTLQEIEPMRKIAWTGQAMGARAKHTWSFEARGDAVAVLSRESFDGWWPRLLPGLTRRILGNVLRAWLRSLKQRAEAPDRSPPPSAGPGNLR